MKSAIKAQADGSIDLVLLDATEIWQYSFSECYALTSVSAPKATKIEAFAFRNCTALTSLTFGTVTYVDNELFGLLDLSTSTTCDLTLGAETTAGDLDVENKTWAGMTWKSITLVDSN